MVALAPVPIPDSLLRRFNYRITDNPEAPASWVARRNFFALQYAYLRGDTGLLLHNNALIEPRYRLSYFHPQNQAHYTSWTAQYPPSRQAPERLGVLQHPTVIALLEHKWKGFELRWKKLLRKGGLGLATLWEAEFEDGLKLPVVIKMNISDDRVEFEKEIKWHDRYHHAFNIVQRLDLNAFAREHRQDGRFDNRPNLEEHFVKKRQPLLILEYADHGNLRDVLMNIQAHGVKPPSIALWQLWEQMIYGLAEVAYQREFRSRWNTDVLQEMFKAENAGPQQLEAFFKKLSQIPISHDVHFDLEESNMLMFESSELEGCPILKFHDFGYYSFNMQREWESSDEFSYWQKRRLLKSHKYLPEQATKDWDSLNYPAPEGPWQFISEELDHGNPVAGRYGSWTNVFIIGRTMHSIMTGLIGALPFVAKRVKGNPIPTYGWRIFDLENRHMDIQLRHLVTQCMHERPADRPSVVNLLRHLMQAKQAGLMASKDHSRTFWSKVLGPPPLPTKRKSHARKVDKLASEGVILDDDAIKTAGRRGERSAVRTKRQPPRAARQGNRPQPSSSSSLASQEQNISPEVARRADSEPRDLADDLGIRIHISTKNLRRRRKQVSRSVRSETSRASLPGTPQLEALEELLPSIERAQEPEAGTEQQPVSGSEKIVLGPELDDSAPWLLQRDPLTPPPGMQW